MFSNLILRNSRRSLKENGLFFSSLVISIVAFYMVLSISTQDVMLFLKKMESDAVDRLLTMIPVFYLITLDILVFLTYFACKYQFERRRHEFGVYLMMGMRRSKLFGMLLAEDLVSSVLALVIGLPVAVLLSEMTSLVTAKLVGTMTIFYVLLYYVWRQRYQIQGQSVLTAAVYGLAGVRIALCMMPQNQWLSAEAPLSWGIYRNIPFALLGFLVIVLFYRSAKERGDRAFRWMWLTIVLSFGFYIPVVLWADAVPMIGMLMIPKTCAYVWTVLIGYFAMKKECK